MKSFLLIALTLASFSTYAHGVKRLTTATCTTGSDTQLGAVVKWDSSVSPFGPNQIIINGEEVKASVTLTFLDEGVEIQGKLQNKEKFAITTTGEKEYETVLKVGETEIPVACTTTTKFRLF